MKTIKVMTAFIMMFFLLNCGGSGSIGGTETGTTDTGGNEEGTTVDTSNLGSKVQAIASALVPSATTSASSSLSALTYGTSDDWAPYVLNETVLTDIFGPVEDMATVTRVRVVVNDFKSTIEDVFSLDPDIDCSGQSALQEGDTLVIPFYGSIANGSADDRHFDCIYSYSGSGSNTYYTLYGQDSNGVIRIVYMLEGTFPNDTDTETRGMSTRNLSVIYATYSEATEDDATVGYLDLQYNQATIYSGVDEVHFTDDDVLFKSRSRITGRAVLDESGNPSIGTGDFTVTKYDKGYNEDDDSTLWTITTKTTGRGSYEEGQYSLFNIDSDSGPGMEPGIFCLQSGSGNIPTLAESTNCESLEAATPWTGHTFPFPLSPAIYEDFESKAFFEGNDTDLISNTGDNFTIPSYSATEVEAETEENL